MFSKLRMQIMETLMQVHFKVAHYPFH
uniref:Uncharacterized protein n=1 Tax=Rhizophora mucronata TaxID=61149 RepID=A0A2P2NTS4_RHIMU